MPRAIELECGRLLWALEAIGGPLEPASHRVSSRPHNASPESAGPEPIPGLRHPSELLVLAAHKEIGSVLPVVPHCRRGTAVQFYPRGSVRDASQDRRL